MFTPPALTRFNSRCHSRASGNPAPRRLDVFSCDRVPAFTGMTIFVEWAIGSSVTPSRHCRRCGNSLRMVQATDQAPGLFAPSAARRAARASFCSMDSAARMKRSRNSSGIASARSGARGILLFGVLFALGGIPARHHIPVPFRLIRGIRPGKSLRMVVRILRFAFGAQQFRFVDIGENQLDRIAAGMGGFPDQRPCTIRPIMVRGLVAAKASGSAFNPASSPSRKMLPQRLPPPAERRKAAPRAGAASVSRYALVNVLSLIGKRAMDRIGLHIN